MQSKQKQSRKIEKKKINNKNFPFHEAGMGIKHVAIAVTAIATLLNLNLNYEKLHDKNTKSFDINNYLMSFFRL